MRRRAGRCAQVQRDFLGFVVHEYRQVRAERERLRWIDDAGEAPDRRAIGLRAVPALVTHRVTVGEVLNGRGQRWYCGSCWRWRWWGRIGWRRNRRRRRATDDVVARIHLVADVTAARETDEHRGGRREAARIVKMAHVISTNVR